jgi:putative transcriptional regulator
METLVELSERIRGLAAGNRIAITSHGLERMKARRIPRRQVELAIQRGRCTGEALPSDSDAPVAGLRQVVTMSGEGLTLVVAIVAFQALEVWDAYRPQEIGLMSMNQPYRYAESGLTNIYLQGGVTRHRTQEGSFVKISDTTGLHRAIARWLVEGCTPLRGAQLCFLRQEMNFTQGELAALLRARRQTLSLWERSRVPMPPTADRQLRALYAQCVADGCQPALPDRRMARHARACFRYDAGGWRVTGSADGSRRPSSDEVQTLRVAAIDRGHSNSVAAPPQVGDLGGLEARRRFRPGPGPLLS